MSGDGELGEVMRDLFEQMRAQLVTQERLAEILVLEMAAMDDPAPALKAVGPFGQFVGYISMWPREFHEGEGENYG